MRAIGILLVGRWSKLAGAVTMRALQLEIDMRLTGV